MSELERAIGDLVIANRILANQGVVARNSNPSDTHSSRAGSVLQEPKKFRVITRPASTGLSRAFMKWAAPQKRTARSMSFAADDTSLGRHRYRPIRISAHNKKAALTTTTPRKG